MLTADRAVAFVRLQCAAFCALFALLVVGPLFYPAPPGAHVGQDYLAFWAASRLLLRGSAALVYDPAAHAAVQAALYRVKLDLYEAFFYPPTFLPVCWPMGLLPVIPSMAAWLGMTGLAYWAALRRLVPPMAGRNAAILGYAVVLMNALYGQNGCLTAALFGAGVFLLGRSPGRAGLCLGLLAIKPQLGLAVPVALLAGAHWRAIAGAAASVAGLAALATLGFGLGIWSAWWAHTGAARDAMQTGIMGVDKLVSLFGAVRLLGGTLVQAYWVQGIGTVAVCALLAWCVRRARGQPLLQGAAMVAAVPFCSPFLLDYDLVMLAVPLAVLFSLGRRDGFLSGERGLLAGLYVAPLLLKVLCTDFHLPFTLPETVLLLAMVVRRIRALPCVPPLRDSGAVR